MSNTELIQSKEDLISYLTTKKLASKSLPDSVNVSTRIRRIIMTDEMQGKFVHNGRVRMFKFESLGGGVYKAYISSLIGSLND